MGSIYQKLKKEQHKQDLESLEQLRIKANFTRPAFAPIDVNDLSEETRLDNLANYINPKAGDLMEITIQSSSGKINKEERYSGENKPLPDISFTKASAFSDLVILVKSRFGQKGKNIEGDLNGDGVVNSLDFVTAKGKI